MQARGVAPVDPFQGSPFNLSRRLPRSKEVDHLGLEQANDAFGQGVIAAVADAADRGGDPFFGEPLGVFDRQAPTAAIRTADQTRIRRRPLAEAWFNASNAKAVVIDVETRQPTIFRAKTSIKNATYAGRRQDETQVQSLTRS